MGGVSRQTLNCSRLFSSAVPLINISLKTYFLVLSQAALIVSIKERLLHTFFSQFILKLVKQNRYV